MAGPQSEMFPEFLPLVGFLALKSPKIAKQIAMVRLLSLASSKQGKPMGGASAVDIIRMFGGEFDNSARRTLAVVAGVQKGGWIPADLLPDEAEIEKEKRALAPELARLLYEMSDRVKRYSKTGK